MSTADFSALVDDVATHGLRQSVVTYEGQVLDGWHRYRACLECGARPVFVEYDGDDPVAYVLSLNLSRRHLSGSQRAAAVVSCSEWRPNGDRSSAPGTELRAVELAERADVGTRTIEHAKTAHRAGLGDAVRDGQLTARQAAELAKPPKHRKPPEPEPEHVDLEQTSDDADRMADMVRDYEAAMKIIESNDAVTAAWDEVQDLMRKLADMTRLYEAKCGELAEMTREAKRWKRKAEGK